MALVQLSALSGDLLAANDAVAVQADIDMVQTMLDRWKNSYGIVAGDYANLEAMAAKVCRHLQDNPGLGRGLWRDLKVAQGWISADSI